MRIGKEVKEKKKTCLYIHPLITFNTLFSRVLRVPQAHLDHLGFQEDQERMFSWDPLALLERMELLASQDLQ